MLDIRVGGYRITERLAKGGMGEVYLARHEIMNREAAVKVLHSELGDKKELVERFLNEARAAASIRHPGIVEIYDVGHVDGRAYIVMEYLRGELLAQRLARTRIDVDKALLLTRQLAGALGAAHACGIIHRDLKPENIFVVPDPDVPGGERTKILDFGIAKLIESQAVVHTMQGAMFGTPAYMAPEQCEDAGQVDRRADLYALGCILYELLSGTPPFGRGGIELVAAHLRDEPPPLRRRVPALPESLEAVVMRLLEKNPDDRFPTCEALVRALDQVQVEHGSLPPMALANTDAPGAQASEPSDILTADTLPSMQRGPIASARATVGAHADTGLPASASPAGASPAGASPAGPTLEPNHVGPTHGSFSLPPEEVAGPVMLAAPTVRPRSRWLSWLVALVALLVAGAAGFWLLRAAPAVVAPVDASAVLLDAGVDAADAGLELRALLDRAQEAYLREDWEAVRKYVREVTRRAEPDSVLAQEARDLRRKVRGEEQFAVTFERFEKALAENDIFSAVTLYDGLDQGSRSRAEADDLWTNWEAAQLKAAERFSKQGQCTKIEEIETQVKRAATKLPIVAAPFEKLLKRCRQRRQDDRDREEPAPGGQEPGGQEPGGQEPGGQEPGGQEPGGQEPGGQEPGGQEPGGQEPGGQEPGGQEPGGQEPGGQEPGGQEPGGQGPGGQEPGGQEPGAETQALRVAGQEVALAGRGGQLPRVAVAQLRQRLADCAREGNVHGQVTVRVEVGAGRRIDSAALEPGHDGLDRCVRALTGQRIAARPGSYRSTLQLP